MPSPINTFTAGTVIESAKVNQNFEQLEDCLDLSGGTMSGELISHTIRPETTNLYNLGSTAGRYASVFASALKLIDTNASHYLSVVAGANITADRTLTLTTVDSDVTITLQGNATIGAQDYSTSGSVTLGGLTLGSTALGTGNVGGRALVIGRNTSGNTAAGTINLINKAGTARYYWTDANNVLRTSANAPEEDGSPGDISGSAVNQWHVDGDATTPGISFVDDTGLGFYRSAKNLILADGGTNTIEFNRLSGGVRGQQFVVNGGAVGTGSTIGSGMIIGRNTSGSGAAAYIGLTRADGTVRYLWVDATDDVRISDAPPQEDGSPSDTSGVVVGTQS